jgi:hypothetical protein
MFVRQIRWTGGRRKGTAAHIAETTKAIVSSPIAVSNTLWHQRAIMLSISSLL